MCNCHKPLRSESMEGEYELLPEFQMVLNRHQPQYEYDRRGNFLNLEMEAPKSIHVYNTDLDAPFFGGNFNFSYNGGDSEAKITFNTFLSFRKNFSDPQKRMFINNLVAAGNVWDSAAEVQIRNINGDYNDKIKLRFGVNIVRDKKNANKVTDVHATGTRAVWLMQKDRENVIRELNVFIHSTRNVLVHELGHVWGLLDEYETKWYEKKFSGGHVGPGSPLIQDKLSILNEGYQDEVRNTGEFRGRHFVHFGRALLKSFFGNKDYMNPIRSNGKVVSEAVYGRIALLKKDIAGSAPYTSDQPFNPQYVSFQIAKRK